VSHCTWLVFPFFITAIVSLWYNPPIFRFPILHAGEFYTFLSVM
jgi:hypothetical protein